MTRYIHTLITISLLGITCAANSYSTTLLNSSIGATRPCPLIVV
jgi:hypothetical protein